MVWPQRCRPTNQCTRIATARFYNGYALAKKWVIVATIAHPQSRDFKRYIANPPNKVLPISAKNGEVHTSVLLAFSSYSTIPVDLSFFFFFRS